jgi:hypothetical protein
MSDCHLKFACNGTGVVMKNGSNEVRTCGLCWKKMCYACVWMVSIGLIPMQRKTECKRCGVGIFEQPKRGK